MKFLHEYPAIISYRMCRSIPKIQHRDVKGRVGQKSPATEAMSDRFRSLRKTHPFVTRSPVAKIKNSTFRVEFAKSPISRELGVKSKLEFPTFRGQFCLPSHFLGGCFKSAQTADFFHNALGVELVFQPFERSVDRLTFSHNYFGHKNSVLRMLFRMRDKQ